MTLAYPTLQQMRDELRVGEEFLAKYNRPGPRYTSYPTAPVWNDAFGPRDLENVFDEAESAKTPVSDRKSTRLNSSHRCISYAVFCLKKKKKKIKNKKRQKNKIHKQEHQILQ